ncbi:cleavage and polyadenylation specificity factor subunit 2 [Nowakowskiella sp. JEL0078]|nr:cleavage and polyadenylation specificity factor subunit 2 [Nowakowskiella sp. JEL0078]
MSFVKFSPLSGSRDDGTCLCYLLQIDEASILLDCGWSDTFDLDTPLLSKLELIAPQIDAVLISHPDLDHLGALPYAYSKLHLNCPIYCTVPVQQMGEQCLLDAVRSKLSVEDFTIFSAADVKTAFTRVEALNNSQNFALSG